MARMLSDEIQFEDMNGKINIRGFGLRSFAKNEIIDEQKAEYVDHAVKCGEPLDILNRKFCLGLD